jgi:hypothetical protein
VSLARFALTLLALLAFTLQSVVTQIHVHGTTASTAASTDSGKPAKPLPGDDQANCSICQAILHAGHFTAPVAAVLPLPSFASFAISLSVRVASSPQSSSHDWQSRAPPRS